MIAGLRRAFDNLFGRGEAAVTVPPLDGALRPNRQLDEATDRTPMDGVDCLAIQGGSLVASASSRVLGFGTKGWTERAAYPSAVTALATVGNEGLAVALADGEIAVEGGAHDGRRYRVDPRIRCVTAMASAGDMLWVANGSATRGPSDWQRDLLERNASGSIWRLDLKTGASSLVADGLAWPAGIVADDSGLVVSEAWKHQLVRIDPARGHARQVLHGDLPAYPGRISIGADGYWLALFAPRSQLVEFVLREPSYRHRMMAEVPEAYWISPKLRSGRSFYESLQGGGVKHLGMLKPWAPTMSAGLCVRLDRAFQPRSSLQSRADGQTHGVTSAIEHGGRLFVAARGDGVVVSLPSETSAAGPLASDRGGEA